MPFVQRIVEPRFLSRTSLRTESGDPLVTDCELEAVINNTLSNALRQLASLVLVANDIFSELSKDLQDISERSGCLKTKIGKVEGKLKDYDPKKVPVPEGDISSFALLRNHFERKQNFDTALFTSVTRPTALQSLYEAAAKTPVHAMRQLDRWRRDGHRSSRFFLCTPVLGEKRRKIRSKVDIDIETRMPAVVGDLRRWTSAEAIGDITVTLDGMNRIACSTMTEDTDITDAGATSDTEGIDHKLPSPEEQQQVIALKFPAEVIPVDISGRRFDRMSVQRRSLLHTSEATCEVDEGGTVRRRTRSRKPRGKRRNTLAGTDQKEIQDALIAGEQSTSSGIEVRTLEATVPVIRSRSTDILRSKKSSPDAKKSHFNTLKQWGKSRLKLIKNSSEASSKSNESKIDIDDINIYETVTTSRRRKIDKESSKGTSYSSSEKSSSISLPISTQLSAAMTLAVKLRESSAQRRQRRNKDEQHSSSGNWSASSESGRASIGSEITTTTHPKSTTSTATSSNSLNHHGPPSSIHSRRRFFNTSTSSSVTSEGTLTPDIIHDIHDDGETSSVYSCDTEGYYTSFHVDSGLKTLREEELNIPMTPLHTTSAFSNSSGNCTVLTAENEYELFGKGSTSTTTSSAGTVCTTLRAAESSRSLSVGPAVPERKSSLNNSTSSASNSLERDEHSTGTVKRSPATSNKATVVAVVHKQQTAGDVSPDSGHNTSSSPIESISSPNGAPSSSEFEFSESSDLEGVDRIERIRVKTTINSSRIPSMCVITPPQSDDESESVKSEQQKYNLVDSTKNNLNISDFGSKNASRTKLNLNLQSNEEETQKRISSLSAASKKLQIINVNPQSGYATVETIESKPEVVEMKKISPKGFRAPSPSGGTVTINNDVNINTENNKSSPQPILKATLMPLNNMLGRLKTNISNFTARKEKPNISKSPSNLENLFDSGDYVTIADVRNNNEKAAISETALYANANDVVKKSEQPNLQKTQKIRETEYISLDELPDNKAAKNNSSGTNSSNNSLERRRQGARVTLDAEGKVVYSSDSLKRRKGAHTTFEPGPFVKDANETPTNSPLPIHRTPKTIRPVDKKAYWNPGVSPTTVGSQVGRVVIRANAKSPTSVRMPSAIVSPKQKQLPQPQHPGSRGAYVHVLDKSSPAQTEERAPSPYRHLPDNPAEQMHPKTMDRFYQQHSTMEYQPQSYDKPQNFLPQRNSPMYRTLPSRMNYEERARTPDLTRGLVAAQNDLYEKGNYYSSLPRRQFVVQNSDSRPYIQQYQQQNSQSVPFNYNSDAQSYQPYSNPNQQFSVGVHHQGLSPVSKNKLQNTLHNESLRISPIDPRNYGEFQSSTPSKAPLENSPAIANLSNKLISPKKSTMSNEELYAVIHKSKKKMNIKTDDLDRASPVSSSNLSPGNSVKSLSGRSTPTKQPETGYLGEARSRSSWSPNNDAGNVLSSDPGSRQSWACSDRLGVKQTSRMDFKKLLLKTNTLIAPTKKLSAVEQLKLSKSQPQQQPMMMVPKQPPPMNILDLSSSPRGLVARKLSNMAPGSPEKQRAPSKLLSPRSNWRFANPRTDILSSTILEDCREDETSASSGERSKSGSQSSVTPRNSFGNASNANEILKRSPSIPKSPTVTGMTRAQILQAQREHFFKSSSSSPIITSREVARKTPSPPTLETAL